MNTISTEPANTAAKTAWRRLVGLDPPAPKLTGTMTVVPVDSILGEELPRYTGPKVGAR